MPERWPAFASGLWIAAFLCIPGCGSSGPAGVVQEVTASQPSEAPVDTPTSVSPFVSGYRVIPADRPQPGVRTGFDILHGTLELSFDFEVAEAAGLVVYDFVVLRDGLPQVDLWTLGTEIDNVQLTRDDVVLRTDFDVTDESVVVKPGVPLRRADTLQVSIAFRARSRDATSPGGLHFVDAPGEDPSLPTQTWCGGMTGGGPTCMPLRGDPGELMTFDLRLAVPDAFTTLASGELVDQFYSGDVRVDQWSVDVPQPATRIGFAVGHFVLIGDEYVSPVGRRLPLIVAAPQEAADLADAVFASTRDMIQTVERRTAVEYPFADYKQVVVYDSHDLVAGLSSLSLHEASILRDDRELLDDTGEARIMRGVAAQWFGGWVGAADGSQIPLLEGFTRLFEAIYQEEVNDREGLEEEMIRARERYMHDARDVRRPVIMASAGSAPYDGTGTADRAALVLYQLGSFIGEETWWRAVRDFTARAGWRAASLDDFRDSAEQAARRNLDRYFEEWFLQPGHPELIIEHDSDATFGVYELRVRQVQDSLQFPTYEIETDVTLHFESSPQYRERVRISSRDTTLRFGFSGRISFVRFDAQNSLLADIRERKPLEHWLSQVEFDPSVGGRYEAAKYLSAGSPSADKRDALTRVAGGDPSPLVRTAALSGLADYTASGLVLRFLFDRSESDPSSACRAAALRILADAGDPSAIAAYRSALEDPSYTVVATAVTALGRAKPATFWATIKPLTSIRSPNSTVELSILHVLQKTPSPAAEAYLQSLLEPVNPARVRVAALDAYRQYSSLGGAWTSRVTSVTQSLLSDRNPLVRSRAREILERR